ncbi:MAG: tetratricopeptide repeat protein [Bradymonadaceae bacterium]|nr:tetratricopeptide repeat protein [Lujinxingiaceae bacterium]
MSLGDNPSTVLTSAKDYFNEGFKRFRHNQFPEALEAFEQALELEKNNGLYMTFYGYLLFLVDPERRDQSEELLRAAVKSGHRQALPDAHLFLGQILKLKGKIEHAHKHFELALALNPGSIEAKRELRLAEMRQKDNGGGDKPGFLKNLFKK